MFSKDADLESRASAVFARCERLALFTEESGRITRPYGSRALLGARDDVADWMSAAGLTTRIDAIGNLRGRYDGSDPTAPALLIGSHLDSVRNGGRYDGPLGILVAISVVERLSGTGHRLPFPIEVIAFAEEEGLRFQATYLGSRAVAGTFDAALLDLTDGERITLRQAVRHFGGNPDDVSSCALAGTQVFGYVEVHIEQGPRLESRGLPVGVVTGIAGQTRADVTFRGETGHAGTVAMELRRDPLPAAAEFVLAVEHVGRSTTELVATVGAVSVDPGASNVIPGSVELSLDLRHPDDVVRDRAVVELHDRARNIAVARNLDVNWQIVQENAAVPCDPELTALLARAVAAAGYSVEMLPSGAGHDGVAISAIAPIAMLFVRCAGGVSHSPAESVDICDIAAAVDVLDRFLGLLGEQVAHMHGEDQARDLSGWVSTASLPEMGKTRAEG